MMDTCSTRIAHPPRHVYARDVPRSLRSAGPRCVFSTTKTTFCSVLQKKDLERDELTKGYPTESHVAKSMSVVSWHATTGGLASKRRSPHFVIVSSVTGRGELSSARLDNTGGPAQA